MDIERQKAISYTYLCHLEEVRKWLENILHIILPSCTFFEERLRNGVLLAKLSNFIAPEIVPLSKIYDYNEDIYETHGLRFKHTENIYHWLSVLNVIYLPKTFHPETTDVYDKKNMPRVIYCLHALISHLHRLKNTPLIEYLHGKITFTDEEIEMINSQLIQHGHNLPSFHTLGGLSEHKMDENTCNSMQSNFIVDAAVGERENIVKAINMTLDSDSLQQFVKVLRHPSLNIDSQNLDEYFMPLYYMELKEDKKQHAFLSYDDIKSSIAVLASIGKVSEAVDTKCAENMWTSLNESIIRIQNLDQNLKPQYLKALSACKRFLEIERCDCTLLSYMNIQDCVDLVNSGPKPKLNNNFHKTKEDDLLMLLQNSVVNNEISTFYTQIMNSTYAIKKEILNHDNIILLQNYLKNILLNESDMESGLKIHHIKDGIKYVEGILQNVMSDMHWLQELNHAIIECNLEAILQLISTVSGVDESNCRIVGYLLILEKQKQQGTSPWMKHNVNPTTEVFINLSSTEFCWNLLNYESNSYYVSFKDLQRIIYIVRTKNLARCICKLQAICKGYVLRHKLSMKNVRQNTFGLKSSWKRSPVVIIQAAWRGYRMRKLFCSILCKEDINFKNLRMFLTIVDINISDYERELHLQGLRGQVVQAVRKNTELMKQINKMDITIGLLVQNRISLMDAVAESKKIGIGVNGLKSLRADNRRILEGYQHLFYTLQTSPHYLASLIFSMPQSKSNKFLQSVIFSLYNFGANQRNEYLLLKLFQFALHEEIRAKFTKPSDVITGNPLVLKMVVNYARQTSGHNALRQILAQLLYKVLNIKEASIETNPVSIYNHWRNQTEMESGKSFSLPYTVSYEDALKYEEVAQRLNNALELLKSHVMMFLKRIVKLKDTIPYGLRFIAKELRNALTVKFPDTPAKEIIKVVGNMLYYQFINSAIVAPDAFDIITLAPGQTMSSFERHTLASIAKILQFAAAKKGFGEESRHLMCLNPFIIECHDIFKQFFIDCCCVEDLDEHYSINEYSEATLIVPPTIYITLEEIIETHALLKEYEREVAADANDPLRELLKALHPVPTLAQLSGYECDNDQRQLIAKTEVCLTLKNKFEGLVDGNTDLTKLFVRAKELLVIIFPFLSGHTLPGALRIEPTSDQEQSFSNKKQYNQQGTLRECKTKLRKCLAQLDERRIVTKDDGYQNILVAVAEDICNKNRYRQQQAKELEKITETISSLHEKTKFYEDQIRYYHQYIEKCLENLNAGKRNVHSIKRVKVNDKISSKHCLKYSGSKLYEKGILLSIEALPPSQFKHIYFEICPTDSNGIFAISGKFMGVELEKMEIDMQELLKLQYDGVGVMDIFGNAKININLLLYLLNKKYYKKM